MIHINNKALCSGCHACVGVCPKQCISMEEDSEGFLYPIIDKSQCISCGLCEKACQSIYPIKSSNTPVAYAAYNKDKTMRMKSSSGGIFTLIAERIINKGGTVFGAAFDDRFNVRHIAVKSKEELLLLRGSKYLQSVIGNSYKQAEELLNKGEYVLFTGTPCQIDGLLHYLKKSYERLYTQDIICHGVPSPMVWQEYLKYQTSAFGGSLDRKSPPAFRRKDEGWRRYSVSYRFADDTEYRETMDKDIYMKAFLSNICLRPSCYSCKSKTLNRNSDITLADFWGIDRVLPDMDDDKGTSLVFINTEKGRRLFQAVSEGMVYKETDINEAVKYNSSAYKSVMKTFERRRFMNSLGKKSFGEAVKKYSVLSFWSKVKLKLILIYSDMIKHEDK